MSGELIERALFSFGRSLHSKFPSNMNNGKARLDFRRPENRELWLTAWRYISNLGMRGLWRTAFEWAKLLLSLDPKEDRYRIVLMIDQLALRARQPQSLVSLIESYFFRYRWRDYPNIALAHGLAYFQLGEADRGRNILTSAVKRFPWVITRLFQELNVEKPPPAVWGKLPPTPAEDFYTNLYITRAKDIWNSPETLAFLLDVVRDVTLEKDDKGQEKSAYDPIPISWDVARHALLTDNPAIIRNLPMALPTESLLPTDPLIPLDSLPSYKLEVHPSLAAKNDDASAELSYQRYLYQEICRAVGGEEMVGNEVAMREACVGAEEVEKVKGRVLHLQEQIVKERKEVEQESENSKVEGN